MRRKSTLARRSAESFMLLGSVLLFSVSVAHAQVRQAWAVHQTAPGASGNGVSSLAVDDAGNLLVGGQSYFPTSKWDIVLTKYTPSGTQLWQSQYHGGGDWDYPVAIAAVGAYAFVAGSSLKESGDSDFVTLKYDPDGGLQWATRYNGPANGSDTAVALAVDVAGNVLVAGNSPGLTSHSDIAVLKYDGAGHQLWAFRYDGPNHNDDRVSALKLDAAGNVYLLGASGQWGGRSEMVTLKLDSSGQQVWAIHHRSASGAEVGARGLALDASTNVIVVATEAYELLTMKYGPDGAFIWAAWYRAEEEASMIAADVRVDAAGHIVTGGNLYGSGTNDSVLVKYDADGHQLWVSRVSHPGGLFHFYDMDMDAAGNTYLTGEPQPDALTVKVGADGNQLWRANYHSTGEFYDAGEVVKADGAGNVYMAGHSIFFTDLFVSVVKYEQTPVDGAPIVSVSPPVQLVEIGTSVALTAVATGKTPLHFQWRFNGQPIPGATGPSLMLDNVQLVNRGDYSVSVSNVVGVTISPEARLTVLMAPAVFVEPTAQTSFLGSEASFIARVSGTKPFTFQWRRDGTNILGGTNEALRLMGLASSDAGGYSVVLFSPAGAVTSSVVALTVSRAVAQVQSLRYNGIGNGSDEQPLLRLGPAGDAVVAARSEGIGTGSDIGVIKYSSTGALLWSRTFNRGGSMDDVPADLALDDSGNIYVTGWSGAPYADRVMTTLKYSPTGQQIWVKHFTNAFSSFATSIAVAPAGGVTVAGRTGSGMGYGPVVIHYDAAGNEQWLALGEDAGYEESQAVSVDAEGNTFLGTTVLRDDDDTDFFLRKFDPSGAVLWTRTFDAGPQDSFTALARDPAGNVVMLGTTFLRATDGVVLKYTPDGVQLWATNFDGLSFQNDFTRTLAVDSAGNITVVSSIEDYDDDQLGTSIVKLDADGHRLFSIVEPDLEVTDATRIAVDPFGNTYVTGNATAKYDALGQRLWRILEQTGTAVAVDAGGDVLVAGHADALLGLGTDVLLVRYHQQEPSGAWRLDLTRLRNGALRLVLPPGTNFVVEASLDLRQWTRASEAELRDLLQPGPPMLLPFPQRFYRLVRTEDGR